MAVYEAEVTIRNDQATVAAFFRDLRNLEKITLPKLKIKLIEPPAELVVGSEIQFELTHFGQTQKMKHKIVEVSDSRLVEQQITGPMQSWTHVREFTVVDDGTKLTDKIEFETPGGLLGLVMTKELVQRTLAEGFEYQHAKLQELLSKKDC